MVIKLPLKKNTQFILMGGGYDLGLISDILLEQKFKKPIIVTHSKKFHKRDNRILKNTKHYFDIFSYAREKKIQIIEEDDVNKPYLIKKLLAQGGNVVFSHACRSIIKQGFLKSFKNLVFKYRV